MMNSTKNTTFTFRTNSELMDKAKEIVKSNDLDMSFVLNALLEKVVKEQEVPAELIETEEHRQKVLEELFAEMQGSYKFFKSGGRGKSLEEVFSKYGV